LTLEDDRVGFAGSETMTRTKWLFYTVLLGAAPIITRLVVMFLMKPGSKTVWFNGADFIAFGFALAVSNVNTLEHRQGPTPSWKTTHIGVSMMTVLAGMEDRVSGATSGEVMIDPIAVYVDVPYAS